MAPAAVSLGRSLTGLCVSCHGEGGTLARRRVQRFGVQAEHDAVRSRQLPTIVARGDRGRLVACFARTQGQQNSTRLSS